MKKEFMIIILCTMSISLNAQTSKWSDAEATKAISLYDEGRKNEKQKNYTLSFQTYLKSAQLGYAPAQYKIGLFYVRGSGVQRNFSESFRWMKLAAENNIMPIKEAYVFLGYFYAEGIGIPKDEKLSLYWYRKSAEERQDAESYYNIGLAYAFGLGVEQDYTYSITFYKKAAEKGHANAANNLGVMYETGKGGQQDTYEAYKYYKIGADGGNPSSQYAIGCAYEQGLCGYPKDIDQALFWFRQSAEQGYQRSIEKIINLTKQ